METDEEEEEGEGAALKKLLSALRKIRGCGELAERLCQEHGERWPSLLLSMQPLNCMMLFIVSGPTFCCGYNYSASGQRQSRALHCRC